MTTCEDWSDFSKLVKAVIRVERCLGDEKKNKNMKEHLCGQSTSGMQGGMQREKHRRLLERI